MLPFITESAKQEQTETFGGFNNNDLNSFDHIYESALTNLEAHNIDGKSGINKLISNRPILESFKDDLLSTLKKDCDRIVTEHSGANTYSGLYKSVSDMFDNCVEDWVTESTSVGQLLPIKTIDLPVLIKQNLTIATKDIMQTEVTKSPVIKKHIERRWIVDLKTGDRWEYPQCFFKNEYKEIYAAGKGLPIKSTPVVITDGLFQYNVAEELTDSVNPAKEKLPMNLRIVKVNAALDPAAPATTTEIPVNMYINMGDGTWVGGNIKDPTTGVVIDSVTGTADFVTQTITLSTASKAVVSVVFDGYLPNEQNERTTRLDRTREQFEWKIEDGFKMDIPYSMEELNDAKALLDMDLYKLTYTDLSDILVQMEDSGILNFLDDEYVKYNGTTLDPLGFNPFIEEKTFDGDYKAQTTALPSEYVEKMLKYSIDRFVSKILDKAKLEEVTFVIYGNPQYVSLLDSSVNWVVRNGDSIGGVKQNYSYGVMNSGNAKIQVVSTSKYDAADDRKLRIIPFPTNKTQFTFKHYKYTTHILTAQNSAYRPADMPGGSMTYLLGVTRNKTVSIQGIQAGVRMVNIPEMA